MEIKWSFDAMTSTFEQILESNLPKFAEQVTLNLPNLKKLPQLKKID
jgi:hypothetical protein